MGFRRFLSRAQLAADPLEHLAELGREEADHPARPFRPLDREDGMPGVSPVAVDKKSVGISVGNSEKKDSESRSRSGYVWMSQKSREAGSEAVRFADTNF